LLPSGAAGRAVLPSDAAGRAVLPSDAVGRAVLPSGAVGRAAPALLPSSLSLHGFAVSLRRMLNETKPVQKPEELVGVCTRESSSVVRTASRADVRAQNLPHRCSYCLVLDAEERRVLVQRRVASKETYPSHWDPCPGGVMGPNESFEENGVRELDEEMGIVIGSVLSPWPPERLFDFWYEDERVRNWGRLLKVQFSGDVADLKLQAEEVETAAWLSLVELAQLLEAGPVSPDSAVAIRRWLSEKAEARAPP